MARSLGRNARNKQWSGLGPRKTANLLRRQQRRVEDRDWRRSHGA